MEKLKFILYKMPLSILLVKVGNVCMTDETSTTVQWTFLSGTSTVGSRTSKEQQARTLETVTTKRTSQIIDGLADGYLGTERKKPNAGWPWPCLGAGIP